MQIRDMALEDLARIHDLEAAAFPDPWSEAGIRETLSQKNTILLTAREEENVIGYLIVYYVLDECEIARIAVAKEHRRQGAAALLIRELERRCREKGIRRIMLDVRESNKGAIAFYRGQGFAEDGLRKNFYTGPMEHAVLMSKNAGERMAELTALPTSQGLGQQI